MEKKVAGFIVAPLWNEFMRFALASTSPDERFERAPEVDTSSLKPVLRGFWQGNLSYIMDSISGKRATEYTPPETRVEKIVSNVHTILHWIDRNDPRGPVPENPFGDSQYSHWEFGVRKWAVEKGIVEENESVIPLQFDDVHTLANKPRISIVGIDPSIPWMQTAL